MVSSILMTGQPMHATLGKQKTLSYALYRRRNNKTFTQKNTKLLLIFIILNLSAPLILPNLYSHKNGFLHIPSEICRKKIPQELKLLTFNSIFKYMSIYTAAQCCNVKEVGWYQNEERTFKFIIKGKCKKL